MPVSALTITRLLALVSSLTALLMLAPCQLSAADDTARVPLTAIEFDSLRLTNGSQLMGRYIETLANGAVRFEQDGRGTSVIPASEIARIERRQTILEAISRRGDQAIAASDWTDIQRIVRFVLERPTDPPRPAGKPDVGAARPTDLDIKNTAAQVVLKALAAKPTVEVAAAGVTLAQARNDADAIITLSRAGLKADPNWTLGYEHQAKVFQTRKQTAELGVLVKAWLDKQPTALIANRYQAGIAEAAGDLRTATEAYRKCFDLHQDWEAGVGFARCSLRRGDRVETLRATKLLIEKGQRVAEARVWLGSALLHEGILDNKADATKQAREHLEQALSAGLETELAALARYNLGLIHLRAGRNDEARRQWSQLSGPLAIVANAHVERTAVDPAQLSKGLAAWAAEHNLCIELENRRWQSFAKAALTPGARAVFLGQIADSLKDGGSPESLHQLSASASEESMRWQAYGHLQQGRLTETEALLDRLPVTDGWTIATRIYLAALRKDDATARTWLKRLDGATQVPKGYAQILVAEFASANDEVMSESFDWPDPDAVATGWQSAAPGTGIAVHARSGKLVIEGTQNASEPTSVYKLEPSDRLRSVQIVLDTVALGSATAGLELMDEARVNGIQAGVQEGRFHWRAADKGAWGPWNPTGQTANGNPTTLRIDLERGRISVVIGASDPVPVSAPIGSGDRLAVGIFGVADNGQTWKATADDFTVQLLPTTRR